MSSFIDITNQRFGQLVVLGKTGDSNRGHILWLCQCDCGRTTVVTGSHLRDGTTKSCGCSYRSHGMYKSKTYSIWSRMHVRCYNIKHSSYKYYGGRGIVVSERWYDFRNFLADMGECPPGLSIDRIDNNGNYEPGNCRWATHKEQQNNKRQTSRFLDISGQKFHRLTALTAIKVKPRRLWVCKCDCGNTVIVRSDCLVNGNTKSCGCLRLRAV